jgi:Protein of unknown function (DUF3379)
MMDHEKYRRALLSDPRSEDAAQRQHRDTCEQCAAYTERLLHFEARLERALQLNMRAPAAALRRDRGRPGRLALAASVLLALLVAGAVWLAVPRASLAAAVVAHMAQEPDAWNTRAAVADPALESVLKNANMHLNSSVGVVSYANSCEFRGHVVPHLVVQSAGGPVTVMVLVHESVSKQQPFDEHGYRGVIVPVAGHGSIALLMRGPEVRIDDVEGIAARVRDAIVWP